MAYGIKYRVEFTDKLNRAQRIDILEWNYGGGIEAVDGSGDPLRIGLQNPADEKYETLQPTFIELTMMVKEKFKFEAIASATDKQYKMEVYEANNLKHVGFVIPQIYSEPYEEPPFPITFRAVSMGILNRIRYLDENGEFYTGKVSAMTVITRCLDQLGYDLDIWDSTNVYETRMSSGSSNSPLTQMQVDQQAYIVEEKGEDRAMYCWDVLEAVLKPLGVNFFQDYGQWVIIPIESRASSRTVRIFNSAGALQSTTTRNPSDNILWIERGHQLSPRPIIRTVESAYTHREIGNLAKNGNFDTFTNPDPNNLFYRVPEHWQTQGTFTPTFPFPGSGSVAVPMGKGGPLGLVLRSQSISEGGYVFYKTPTDVGFPDDTKIGLTLRYSPTADGRPEQIVDLPIQLRVGTRYLDATGKWVSSPTNIEINDIGDSVFSIFGGGDYRDFEIISEELPADGDLEIRIYRPKNDETDVTCVYAFIQLEYLPAGEPESSETHFIGERDVESYADEIDYPTIHGDGPTNLHLRSFFIGDDKTEVWTRGGLSGGISKIVIQEILREYEERSNIIQGRHRVAGLFDRYFAEFGEAYTPLSGIYHARMGHFDGQVIQIQAGDIQGTVREYTPKRSGSTSGGSGGRNVRPDIDRLSALGETTSDYQGESVENLDCELDLPVRKGIEYWVVNESELSRVDRRAGIYSVVPITTKPDGTRLVPSDPDYDDADNIREYGPGLLEDDDAVPIQRQIINAPSGSLIYKAPGQDEFEQFVTENFQITTSVHLTSLDETTDANAGAIIDLNSTVTQQGDSITANSDAIIAVETRVTDVENDIDAQSSSILILESETTILNADVSSAIRSGTAPTTRPSGEALKLGDTWVDTSDDERVYVYDGMNWVLGNQLIDANASAILSAEARITDAENDIVANSDSIVNLNSQTTIINADLSNTIRSGTAPTVRPSGEPLKVGDSWTHTGEDDRTYIWTGSAWVKGNKLIDTNASAIVSANSNISNLQTDSNHVFRQTTFPTQRPSGEALKAGDVLVKTDEDRRTYSYNGTGWEKNDGLIDENASATLDLNTRITTTEGDVANIEATAVLKVDANGNIASVALSANHDGTTINIKGDQVKINNWEFIQSDGSGHGILRSTTQIDGNDAIRLNGTTGLAEFENVIIRSNNSVIGTQDEPVDRLFIGAPAPSGMRAQMLTVTHSETTNPYSVIFNRIATEAGRNTLLVHHPSTSVNNRIAQFTNSSGQVFQIYANGQVQLTGYFDFDSISQPASPSAGVRLFVQTVTGVGRVLRAKFPNGNVVDIATE